MAGFAQRFKPWRQMYYYKSLKRRKNVVKKPFTDFNRTIPSLTSLLYSYPFLSYFFVKIGIICYISVKYD